MKRAARSPLQARWLVPFALVVAVMAPSPLASQAPPSPADVLGYDIGEEFTDVAESVTTSVRSSPTWRRSTGT